MEADHDRRRAQQRLLARTPGSTARPGCRSATGWFKNYESASYGYIGFDQALQLSCDTFFYRVGLQVLAAVRLRRDRRATPRTRWSRRPRPSASARETGIDLPGEAPRADRGPALEARLLEVDEGPTTARSTATGSAKNDYLQLFAHEFCLEGNHYRAGDAVNFAIGQGDTIVTPLQLARAYAALSNGGTLYEPRVAKAIVAPDGTVLRRFQPKVAGPRAVVRSRAGVRRHRAARARPKVGTLAWKFTDFPLDKVHIRGKTGSAEVYGKQSTSWVATYDENYVVVMMVVAGRHRLGHLRPGRARDLGVAVRHHRHDGGRRRAPPSPASRRPPGCRRSCTTARSCRPPGAGRSD